MKWTLADVWGVLAFILMMTGIAGLSVETFSEGGWGERVMGATWEAAISNPMVMAPVLALGGVLAILAFTGRLTVGKGNYFSDALVYLLMGLGIYFIYRWVS